MEKFRFVGSSADIGSIALRRFGQAVEIDWQAAQEAIRGGCALIPEDVFGEIGFTEQELALYAYPGPRATAPEASMEKFETAQSLFREARG